MHIVLPSLLFFSLSDVGGREGHLLTHQFSFPPPSLSSSENKKGPATNKCEGKITVAYFTVKKTFNVLKSKKSPCFRARAVLQTHFEFFYWKAECLFPTSILCPSMLSLSGHVAKMKAFFRAAMKIAPFRFSLSYSAEE